jgi:hypothetical protein
VDAKQARAERARINHERDLASDYGIGRPGGPMGWMPPREPRATGNAALMRRLRKGFPELHQLVLAGEITPYAAALAAGFRRRAGQ